MNLESERLLIAQLNIADVEAIHHLNTFEETARYNTLGVATDIEKTRRTIQTTIDDIQSAEPSRYSWTIRLNDSNEFLGEIGMKLYPERYKRGEIHYSLLPAQWGKGYATEAAKRVLKFGFETLDFHRMEAGVAVENTASIKLLERIGMTREGVGRKILPLPSGWQDNYSYSILDTDKKDF